ncbi:MAG TPA: neocarzinostatin apoprotein domain-containing protein [Jatrophihabitans sp.]|nr:neocarzinostatin apoprotein domain-containing protein [Jatrophihabitans sp.]
MTHIAARAPERRRWPAAAAVLAVLVLAACGGSSSVVVHTAAPPVHTSSSAPTATVTSGQSNSSPATGQPSAKVTPATGLADRQRVQVDGSGFTPGESLQVIECADKGTKTGPGDCNLTGMTPTTADGVGRVSVVLTVLRGPFGGNNIVCSAKQPCLVSVTQASLTPSQEADVPIAFATK